MHQLLLDYAASRGRVSYYHLANKSTTNDFLNVIHCINCMFELSLHLFMKKYIPALETLCLWRNNALFFKLSPWSLPVSHANTAHFSLQSIVLTCVVFSAHTLHPQALVLFFMSLRLLIHPSLSPSLFGYMTHLSAFCEISASLQAHAGWTKCESEQSVTTLNWELLHCQNTALYTYGGSSQRHKVM